MILRGKYHPEKEVITNHIIVGEPLFRELKCGCFVDYETGKEIKVIRESLEDFLKNNGILHGCRETK